MGSILLLCEAGCSDNPGNSQSVTDSIAQWLFERPWRGHQGSWTMSPLLIILVSCKNRYSNQHYEHTPGFPNSQQSHWKRQQRWPPNQSTTLLGQTLTKSRLRLQHLITTHQSSNERQFNVDSHLLSCAWSFNIFNNQGVTLIGT